MDKIECHDIHIPLFTTKHAGGINKEVPIALESFKILTEEDSTRVLGLNFIINPDLAMFPLYSKDGRLVLIFYDKSVDFKEAYNFYFEVQDE